MNYYPFHIGDYVSATRHLSWEEDAAFRRLLDTYYTTEKPIPLDHRSACRLVMAQTDSQREAVRVVLEEFFTRTEDGWVNKRADSEIAAMREKRQKQREKANKRWDVQRAERGNATAQQGDAAASKVRADAMPPTPTPTPTPTPILSEPIGSGAGAPPSPADVIFALGVPLLTAAGVTDRNARSMLGVQRKQHGDAAVVDALQRCAVEKPIQPVPWLQATLKAKQAPNKRQAVEDDNRNIALAWANGAQA